MTSEDPTVALARVEGRLGGLETQLAQVRTEMATKEGQENTGHSIERLERALALEAENRTKADGAEALAREKADTEEKVEREKVAARLQLVEDRQETRKYSVLVAILLAAVGLALNLLESLIGAGVGG